MPRKSNWTTITAKAVAGNPEAIERVVRRYLGLIAMFAERQRTRNNAWAHNTEDIQDLVQLAVAEVLQRLPKYDKTRGRLSTFVGAVVRGIFSKQNLRLQRHNRRRGSMTEMGLQENSPSPEDIYIHVETRAHREGFLADALNMLEPREKYIINRRFRGDATLETVGKELKISIEWVRLLEKSALAKMREFLEKHGG